jgi:hypothetical protein
VNSHQPRKPHADDNCYQGQSVVLQSNDFVVETEYVLPNETLGWCVLMLNGLGRSLGHVLTFGEMPRYR